jgi:hypothetical protein
MNAGAPTVTSKKKGAFARNAKDGALAKIDWRKQKGLPDREAFRNFPDEAKRNYFFGCPGVAGAGAGFGAAARGGADEDFAAPAFTG